MASIYGVFQPAEVDGTTFSLGATTASGNKTFTNAAYLYISATQPITVTFGQVNASILGGTGHAPTTPSAVVGMLINIGPPVLIWLGPNRDTINVFNTSASAAVVSIQPAAI